MRYKFLDNTNTSLMRIDDDGVSRVSCSADDSGYKNWLAEGNTPEPAMTEEEASEAEKQRNIAEAKAYLAETDWVVTKISETALREDNTSYLLEKYSGILDERTKKRTLINSLETL